MSSESTLCTELLLEVALDTEETLLTLRDLDTQAQLCTQPHGDCKMTGLQADRRVSVACLYPISTFMECTWTDYKIPGLSDVKGQLRVSTSLPWVTLLGGKRPSPIQQG